MAGRRHTASHGPPPLATVIVVLGEGAMPAGRAAVDQCWPASLDTDSLVAVSCHAVLPLAPTSRRPATTATLTRWDTCSAATSPRWGSVAECLRFAAVALGADGIGSYGHPPAAAARRLLRQRVQVHPEGARRRTGFVQGLITNTYLSRPSTTCARRSGRGAVHDPAERPAAEHRRLRPAVARPGHG
jgi:hypothetical protein